MKREVSAHCLAACFVAMAWLGLSPTAQAGSITNVVPGSGPFAGGNSITIQGTSLGNGSDITNVVLHGATATIQPGQTTGRVSVLAGPALAWGTGDVAVASASLGTTVLTNGYCYSAAGDIHGASLPWTTIGTLPAPREYVMAASVSNVIYLIGGAGTPGGSSAATVYKFDTVHPWVGWSSVSNLPVGMQGGAAVSVGSTIYVLGGGGSANSGSASVYKYDTAQPALGWVSVSSLPAARWRLGAAVVNGRIYVTGGSDNSWNNYPDCWVYDTAHPANGWTAISNLPYSIGTHGCEAANGKVYVFGGIINGSTYLSTVYEYDPAQPARGWVRLFDLPEARGYTKSAHLNGRIYCIGGNTGSGLTSGILEFDTAAPERGWVSVASLPQNGWTDQATVGAGGNLYAMGGDWNYSQTENAVQEGQWMPGVLPAAGPVTGGNSVAISGTGLGNGTDVTNVTLCGFAAAISSQTATQVLVTASTATGITNGDAIVQSVSRGAATCAGGYTYHDHDLVVLGTNGMAITNNEAATVAKGTQFQRRPLGTQISFVFALQNAGGPLLHITGVSTSGVGASQFAVGGVPATIDPVTYSNLTLTYSPTLLGVCDATVTITHDGTNTPYLINLEGTGVSISPTNGPAGGSNTVTVVSGVGLGSGSDITNVTLCGIAASILSQSKTTVVVRAGYSGSGVAGDLVISSTSSGRQVVISAYVYNPPGSISTVSPNFGSAAGGDTITISGSNLGNGSDITNVTLAGFNVAQITSQNAGQVVVRSGASGTSTSGAAVVYSTSFGASTKAAAFTYYAWPDIAVLGIDGSRITNGAPARAAAGTDFRSLSLNASLTHTLTITNDSGNPLTISGITTSGTGSAAFRILNPPSSVPGMSVAMFDVQFTASAVTSYDAMVSIANNSTSTPYAFGVHGSGLALSTNHAPFSGGMTVTLVGAGLGNGSDITNVTVCGVKASIVSQSATQLVFAVGYGGTGTGDILIQSASAGDTIVRNGFTYNQQGHIFGAFMGWNAISNLPSPRIGAAAASVSNVIYVIGGIHDDYGSALATVFRFDTAHPELGWSSVSNLPAGRYGSAAASVGSKLYVLSGQDSGWNFMPSAFVYDTALPAAGWQSISNLPFARWRHGAAAANGKIYVTGGEGNALVNYADCCEYDPAHPESGWKTIRSLPGERGTHGCESIDGKVYVFGGIDNGANYLQSTLVYDPFNPELGWVATANLPKMLAYLHSAQANGRMYTVDGNSGDGDLHCYEYDLNAGGGTWSTLPVALPDGTAEHAACGAGGKIYRLGGESTSSEALEGSWSPGIYPIAGPVTGGITVAISGENLGNGSDITNVTLCGIPVSSIVSQSGTQVVVIAGPAPGETNGDVMVFSQNYGATIKQNGYTYSYPHTTVFAASGLTITNTEPPSVAKGTDFGEVGPFGLSRSFVITNSGGADLIISGVTTSGPGAAQFQVKNMPLTLAGLSAAGFNIVFAPQAVGIHTAVVVIASNASNTPNYQIIVQGIGYVVSPSNGPAAGSNTVCIQGLNLGNGSDITNVIVHGTGAAITSQNPTQVIVQVGASGPGVGNILVQSTSQGSKRPINAYRYNQPGHIFGPFAGWTTVSSFPDSRSYIPCGTALGKVYAYGGYVQNLGGRVESWVYDPAQPTLGWTSISNLPVAAYGQAGVGVGDKLYCLDGWWGGPVRSAYVYDPMQPTLGWVSISNMPIGALDLGATTVSGKVCAVGGDLNGPLSSSVNTYDPAHPELAWAGISNLPVGNAELGAANVDGRPYSVGGLGASRSLFEYDPYEPENGWTSLTNLPMDVRGLGAAGVNGRLFAIGGYNASLGGVNNVWVYDPQYPENGWTSFPGLPDARDYAGVTALNGQQIYVIGGYNQWLGQQSSVFVGGFSSGVSPSVGPTAGGNAVTIFGCHLGSGSDITNVTLCGISVAAITSQSATQVVVTAGASPSETNGDVVVYSTAFGITIETNGYTYKQPYAIFLGADGGVITNNAAASVTRGTDFGGLAVNAHASRPFAVTNYGARLEITNVSITGSGAAQFSVSVLPVLPVYVDPLTRSNFSITFSPTAIGLQTAVVTVTSTAGNDPVFRLNLAGRGYVLSTNIGPNAGGNVLTIFGQGLGNGADITNVTICGIQASILSQNATQVVVRAGGGGGGGGACDILIQSASQGDQIVSEAYTYNSASAIHGPLTGWISVSNLPAPREYLAAASCNGKVYAIGGDNNNTPCSDVFVYDPAAPAAGWTTVSNLPMPLTQIAAASISGKVYAVGGYSGGGQSPTYQYDPNQPQSGWVAVSNMPAVSYGLGATAVGGTLYAVGGADSMGDTRSSVWSYNPNRPQDGWQIAPSLPGPREYMTPVAIKGKLYAMGGLADPSTVTSDTLEYDPLHPEAGWTSVSNLPAGRTYHAAAVAYGRAYVLGGYYESGPDVCMYHPTEPANGWTAAAGMPQGGWGIAAVGLNNTIYAFGGYWGSSDQVAAWQSVFDSGVSPASGRVAGGDTITIAGDDMGDGGDVTNVYLCGIPVSAILSQSPTQIVVTAGASGVVRTGDVVVCSVSFGSSVKSNAFVYNGWIIVASAGLHGTISPTGSVAMVQGSATNFVCTADAYYHIGSLLTNGAADATASGFAVYTSAWAAVTTDGTVSVSFAENLAPLGTPEWWLATYGWTNDFGAAETNDADHDGSLNWQEYLAGTDPTNGNDYLKFDGIFPQSGALTLDLMSHTGRLYDIDSSSNLLNGAGWSPVTGNVAGTESTLSITNSPAPGTLLYRIKVRKP